ncbi:hypothetical protein B0H11DRAFT_1910337 [Mycena galericulata]|nr:hypothetical protein B0H11DRAFT_1910337 [Mycena galericulata]
MPPVRSRGGTSDNPWPVSSSPPPAPQDVAPSAPSVAPRPVATTHPLRKIRIFDSPPLSNTLRINKGPPSTIPRDLARRQGATSDFAAAARRAIGTISPLPPVPNDRERHAQAIERQRQRRRDARDRRQADDARINRATAEYEEARQALVALATNAPPARASRPRIRPNCAGTPLDPLGWRAPHEEELTRDDLLLNGVAPTPRETNRSHQRCGICLHIKSHPVSQVVSLIPPPCTPVGTAIATCASASGSSSVMNMPPHRNYEEEAGLALDFPDWVDESVVDYSWEGLRFPRCRVIIAPDSDDEPSVTQAGGSTTVV